jgi:hypothetical protein
MPTTRRVASSFSLTTTATSTKFGQGYTRSTLASEGGGGHLSLVDLHYRRHDPHAEPSCRHLRQIRLPSCLGLPTSCSATSERALCAVTPDSTARLHRQLRSLRSSRHWIWAYLAIEAHKKDEKNQPRARGWGGWSPTATLLASPLGCAEGPVPTVARRREETGRLWRLGLQGRPESPALEQHRERVSLCQ